MLVLLPVSGQDRPLNMRAIILFALLLSGASGSADAADQADTPAIRLLEDIHAGRPVDTVEGGPELSDLELSEIAKLAGCLPTSDRHQDALVPIIDWNCAENPDDSRTVTLYMSDDGVEDVLIQPLAANFRPDSTGGDVRGIAEPERDYATIPSSRPNRG